MSPSPTEDLRRLISVIEKGLAGLPPLPGLDTPPHRYAARVHRHAQALAALTVDLEETGSVRVSFGSGGVLVRAHGIAATSTDGATGALRNWLTRARKRLEAEAAE